MVVFGTERLLRNVKVQDRIKELQAKISKKLEFTKEKISNDLEEARGLAMLFGQFSASIKASELQGSLRNRVQNC